MRLRLIPAILIIILLPIMAACGGSTDSEDAMPTLMATSIAPAADGDGAAQSPRGQAAPSDRVPATWTPRPTLAPLQATPRTVGGAPQPGSPEASGDTYEVMPGDTLAEIAEQFGVDLNDLAQLNGIEDIDVIEVGQILQIPGS